MVSKKQGRLLPAIVAISSAIFTANPNLHFTHSTPVSLLMVHLFCINVPFQPMESRPHLSQSKLRPKAQANSIFFQSLINAKIIAHVLWYSMIQTSFITKTASGSIKTAAPSLP